MSKFVDILGTEIQKGDFVAVGQRSHNTGALTVAIVLDQLVNDDAYYDKYKIRVLGSKKNWEKPGYTASSRYGDTFPDRVVVINSSVPEELQGTLWAAYNKYWEKKDGR